MFDPGLRNLQMPRCSVQAVAVQRQERPDGGVGSGVGAGVGHGGGNWRLGRLWPNEWNQMIMEALLKAEREAGRTLTRNAILKIVARYMKAYDMPMNFTPGRRR